MRPPATVTNEREEPGNLVSQVYIRCGVMIAALCEKPLVSKFSIRLTRRLTRKECGCIITNYGSNFF